MQQQLHIRGTSWAVQYIGLYSTVHLTKLTDLFVTAVLPFDDDNSM